jgi:hypothetical protein
MGTPRRAVRYSKQINEAIKEYVQAKECTEEEACSQIQHALQYPGATALKNIRNENYEIGRYRPIRWRHDLLMVFLREAGLDHCADALDLSYEAESKVIAGRRKAPPPDSPWFPIPDEQL